MLLRSCCTVWILLWGVTAAAVFLDNKATSQVLTRRIRANSFIDKFNKHRMERECVEERCRWEEAREIFEDVQKTNDFWAKYVDGDACESLPCAHGGLCKDGIGSYSCFCQTGYQGFNCEIVIPELCENKNGGCDQFCNIVEGNVQCFCADGYFLAPDDKSCHFNMFIDKREANAVLQRGPRANSGYLEELKKGNLERECVEEICDYEEAREVFENDDATRQFWLTYKHREPCLDNPCHNNGTCIYMGTTYVCQCLEGFEGRYCDTVFEESLKCLYQNGQCQHFCDGSGEKRRCSCAAGYQLGEDGRQCIAQVKYPCGRLAPAEAALNQSVVGLTRLAGANHCPRGECPWQVLVQLNGSSHCGGVLIDPRWVITAAHCIHGNDTQNVTVVAGEHHLDIEDGTEQEVPVSMVIIHHSYVPATGDSDVALLQLGRPVTLNHHVVPVCLPTKDFAERELLLVRYHTVSGWGKRTTGGNAGTPGAPPTAPVSPVLRKMSVPIIQNSQCSQKAQFNFTSNMLCAGYLEGRQDSCRGDDGSPLVTMYGSTHFLTGVVGWGRGCSHPGYYGVYANMANFVDWVEATMEKQLAVVPANRKPV